MGGGTPFLAGSHTGNNGVDLASATFYLTLCQASRLFAQHAFSMSSFAGNNIWLIGDPTFIEHCSFLVHLNEGTAVYDRGGGTGAHRDVLANLRNASEAATRSFTLDGKNNNTVRTRDVIVLNKRTLPEDIV